MRLSGDRCQCAACGAHFNSVRAFDKHRVGEWSERRCLTSAGMQERGMRQNKSGFWVSKASNYLHREAA